MENTTGIQVVPMRINLLWNVFQLHKNLKSLWTMLTSIPLVYIPSKDINTKIISSPQGGLQHPDVRRVRHHVCVNPQ